MEKNYSLGRAQEMSVIPFIVLMEDGLFPLWILKDEGHSLGLALRRRVIFLAMSKGEGSFLWSCLR
jgi:hypothetical protein